MTQRYPAGFKWTAKVRQQKGFTKYFGVYFYAYLYKSLIFNDKFE